MSTAGVVGRPAERSNHVVPSSGVYHTRPPPKLPPKATATWVGLAGSMATARPLIADPMGGVLLNHVDPPSGERITFIPWLPIASATVAQITCGFAGLIATSKT